MKIQSYRLVRFLNNFFLYLILTFFALVMIFPFLYMLTTSFKTPADTFRYPPRMMPRNAVTIAVDGYGEPLPLYYVDVDGQRCNTRWPKATSRSAPTPPPATSRPPWSAT